MSSYTIITDPSGVNLQNLTNITYRSNEQPFIYQDNLGSIYELRNNVGILISDQLIPYKSPVALNNPRHISLGYDNILFIANNTNINIMYPNTNTQFNYSFTINDKYGNTINPGSLHGVIFDTEWNLFISDYINNYIYVLPKNSIVAYLLYLNNNLIINGPKGLEIDSSNNIYIANSIENNIIKISNIKYNIDNSGEIWYSGDDIILLSSYTGLSSPSDVAFDKFNNLYISNTNMNNIIKYTNDATISTFLDYIIKPNCLTFNYNNILFVGSLNNSFIYTISNNNINTFNIIDYNEDSIIVKNVYDIIFDNNNLDNLYVSLETNDYSQIIVNNLSNYIICPTYNPELSPDDTKYITYPLSYNYISFYKNDVSSNLLFNGPTSITQAQEYYITNYNNNTIVSLYLGTTSLYYDGNSKLIYPICIQHKRVIDITTLYVVNGTSTTGVSTITHAPYGTEIIVIKNNRYEYNFIITGDIPEYISSIYLYNNTTLYVSDGINNKIYSISLTTDTTGVSTILINSTSNNIDLNHPYGLSINSNYLYISSYLSGKIHKYNLSDQTLNSTFVLKLNGVDSEISLSKPLDITIKDDGNVFLFVCLAGIGGNKIVCINSIGTVYEFTNFPDDFNGPTNISYYNNFLYIGMENNDYVIRININNYFPTTNTGFIIVEKYNYESIVSKVVNTIGIYFNEFGLLYFTSGSNNIYRINIIGDIIIYNIPILNNPISIASDIFQDKYIVTNKKDIIKITTVNSEPYADQLIINNITLSNPTAITRDYSGFSFYVISYIDNTIVKISDISGYTANGEILDISGVQLSGPCGIAHSNILNCLFVANEYTKSILKISLVDNTSTTYSSNLNISNPCGITVDDNGNVYISSYSTNNIYIITNDNYTKLININYPDYFIDISNCIIETPTSLLISQSNESTLLLITSHSNNSVVTVELNRLSYVNSYNSSIKIDGPWGIELSNIPDVSWNGIFICNYNNNEIYTIDIESNQLQPLDTSYNYIHAVNSSGTEYLRSITTLAPRFILSGTDSDSYSNYFMFLTCGDGIDSSYSLIGLTGITYNDTTKAFNAAQIYDISMNPEPSLSGVYADNISLNNPTGMTCNTNYNTIYLCNYGDDNNTEITAQRIICIRNISTFDPTPYIYDENTNPIPSTWPTTPLTCTISKLRLDNSNSSIYKPIDLAMDNSNNTLYVIDTYSNSLIAIGLIDDGVGFINSLYYDTRLDLSSYGVPQGIVFFNDFIYITTSTEDASGNYTSPGYILQVPSPYNSTVTNSVKVISSLDSSLKGITTIKDKGSLLFSKFSESLIGQIYLEFQFKNVNLTSRDNTLYIYDNSGNNTYVNQNNLITSFNVYDNYVILSPTTLQNNNTTDILFNYITPNILPNPTDFYTLLYSLDGNNNVLSTGTFCNNCVYNKSKFIGGTYPTGMAFSDNTKYLYVALKDNSISRIDSTGIVNNSYIPSNAGLQNPTKMHFDGSNNLYILNSGGTFISKINLDLGLIVYDLYFYINILKPISITYYNGYIYLLSGITPNIIITKISTSNPSNSSQIPLPFGILYDSKDLEIDEYITGYTYLYVTDSYITTTGSIEYKIVRILLSTNFITDVLYSYEIIVSGLTYQPDSIVSNKDGYLYVANKTSNNISKISLIVSRTNSMVSPYNATTNPFGDIENWASINISVPSDLCFDDNRRLCISNSGINPNTNNISKIYTNYFNFKDVNVSLTTSQLNNSSINPVIFYIYNVTKGYTYVDNSALYIEITP